MPHPLASTLVTAMLAAPGPAAGGGGSTPAPHLEVATLGGGCFWCLEAVYQDVRGVHRVVSGYAGGHVEDPSYEQVVTGRTGHAEVVQVHYDPEVVSYDTLLEVFWTIHDPTTRNRQGADVGPQYRSIILVHDPEQAEAARRFIDALRREGRWEGREITTEVVPLEDFYPAEDHHQDYFARNPDRPYCALVVSPKLDRFRKEHSELRRGRD